MEKDLHVQRRLPHPSSRATWTGNRYELPRARLLGGDQLKGGRPCAPGHAGRSSVSWASRSHRPKAAHLNLRARQATTTILATIILVVAQVLGLFACISTPAIAATGNDPMTITLDGGHDNSRHALDGIEAYCCNAYLSSPPVGTVLRNWKSGSLALDYVLYHSDGGPSDASPHYKWNIAKWAVWVIMGSDPFYLDHYAGGGENPNGPTIHKLYDEAMAFQNSGGDGPERGCSRIYEPPSSAYQPICVCIPQVGDIQLSKASSLPDVTTDDPCYSLEGAEYTVYRDATCSSPVDKLITDASGTAKSVSVATGTYWVKESKAPQGFIPNDATYEVQVSASKVTVVGGGDVTDVPLYAHVGALVRKGDAELLARGSLGTAQGDASLAGARFVVERYANTSGDASGEPQRSWMIETDESGKAALDDSHLVGGDEPYRDADGAVVLPLGTYSLQEVEAPYGYLLPDGPTCLFAVVQDGDRAVVRTLQGPTPPQSNADEALFLASDEIIRGGVCLGKIDAQRGDHVAQGAATLEGAVLAIELEQGQPVIVEGTSYSAGQMVTTLTIGADGTAQTTSDLLPFGSYVAYEVEASRGYLLTSRGTWRRSFQIREEGAIVDLSDSENSVPNLVKRGDLEFIKVDGQTMSRMGRVPFLIESLTTGERHVVVTDDNGYFSSDAAYLAHGTRTNANDAALSDDGILDEEALDPEAGTWFSGGTDIELPPNDLLGALPYDTYRVTELRASTNEGFALVTFDVRVSRDQYIVDGGTINDELLPTVQTTLGITDSREGSDVWTLTDIVHYGNVTADGRAYEVHGTLHLVGDDGSDQGVLVDASGNVAESWTEFVPSSQSGSVEVPFEIDVRTLRGHTIVAFEELWCDGELMAEHADVSDVEQSVSVPEIRTTLTDDCGAKEVDGTATVSLVDEVRYQGLTAGKTYELTGTLMDKATGEPVVDANGQPITAASTFVADSEQGVAWVTFVFDGCLCKGKTVVAFESLSLNGVELATHADLSDEDQAVTVPLICTNATDSADGDHELLASETARIVDTVSYEGLCPGEVYVVSGTLVERDTGKNIVVDEAPVTAETPFSPESPDGSIEVAFELDASTLAGTEVTVFEVLLHGEKVVATHEDLSSEEQSLRIPKMGTTAATPAGEKTIPAEAGQTIVDTISYQGLTPGRSYIASGVLHLRGADGSDVGPLTDEAGAVVASSTTFTPEKPSGTAEVTFTIDASNLGGKSLVAFELLMVEEDESIVASHEDIGDGGQSVQVKERPETPVYPPTKRTRQLLPTTGDLSMPIKAMAVSACFALALGAWMRKKDLMD